MPRLIPNIQPYKHLTEIRAQKDPDGVITFSVILLSDEEGGEDIGHLDGIIVPMSPRSFYDHMDQFSSDAETVATALMPSMKSGKFYDRWGTAHHAPMVYVDRVEIRPEARGQYRGYLLMHALVDFLGTLSADSHAMLALCAAPIVTDTMPAEVFKAKCRSLGNYWETFGLTRTRYKTENGGTILVHNLDYKFPEDTWAAGQGLT